MAMPAPEAGDPRWALELAGGALMDLGCYDLHPMRVLGRRLCVRPHIVAAAASQRRPGVDQWCDVHVESRAASPAGAPIHSMVAETYSFTLRVVGTRGEAIARNFIKPHDDDRVCIRTPAGTRVERLGTRPSSTYQLEAFASHLAQRRLTPDRHRLPCGGMAPADVRGRRQVCHYAPLTSGSNLCWDSMSWKLPMVRAAVSGLAPLATAAPAPAAIPPTMFESMRAALRRVRARTVTLPDLVVDAGGYDVPLATPIARPPSAPAVIGTFPVGPFPTAIAVSPDGRRVYVVNSSGNSVAVLDAHTHAVIGTVSVGTRPYGIALAPDGSVVYVTNADDNSVSTIDKETLAVTATIGVGENPYAVAVSPGGDRVYVTNQGEDSLSVIDASTHALISTVDVGAGPTGVAVTPDGRRVCVVNNAAHSMTVIDPVIGLPTAQIPLGKHPAQVAITPDGTRGYVTNAASASVSVVDLSTGTVAENLLVGTHPIGVAISPDGRLAYITALDGSRSAGSVTILGIATGGSTTLTVGAPYGVAASPAGGHAYVTNFVSQAISVISAGELPGSDRVTKVGSSLSPYQLNNHRERALDEQAGEGIAVNRSASAVTVDAETGRAFVVRSEDGCIDVIEEYGQSDTVVVGNYPSALVLNRDATRAYVTNLDDGSVSVIDTAPTSGSCNTVIGTLDIGPSWSTGLIASRDGARAYAVHETEAYLSVIDTAPDSPSRDTVIGEVDLPHSPAALRLSPNGRWIYTINHFDNAVWAIHTVTKTVAVIPVRDYPYRLSLSPNGLRLYASLTGNGSMSVIDTDPASVTYHRVTARLRLGGHVPDPVFTIAGARAYVANSASDSVSVIDTATSSVSKVPVGHYPLDVAVSPDGRRAYICNFLGDSVSVVDSASHTLIGAVAVGSRPCRIAVTADGSRALVVNNRDDSVTVIDTDAASVSGTISVGRNPFDVTLSRDGSRGCVRHRDGVSVLSI